MADFLIAQRRADVLNIPAAYFYAEDDYLAELAVAFHRVGVRKKALIVKAAEA